MKRWMMIGLLALAGCQFQETNDALLDSGGPSLRAFPSESGIQLVWNNYVLPYSQAGRANTLTAEKYRVLISHSGPADLDLLGETTSPVFTAEAFTDSGPYWFQIEAEYEGGATARSNIVMATTGLPGWREIPELSQEAFAAGYTRLASGTPVFLSGNQQDVPSLKISPSNAASSIQVLGAQPDAHPFTNSFLHAPKTSDATYSLEEYSPFDSISTVWLTDRPFLELPSWNDDGSQVAYLTAENVSSKRLLRILYLTPGFPANVSAMEVSPVESVGAGIPGPGFPDFAPGSRKVAVDVPATVEGALVRNIVLADPETRQDSVLIHSPWTDTQPQFSPDGRQMAFVSDRSGVRAVWLLDMETGGLRQLTGSSTSPLASQQYALRWSADGQQLWFTGILNQRTSCFEVEL